MPRQTAVGLDIGTSAVRAAEVDLRGSRPQVKRLGQVALPPGAVRHGEVVDVEAVAAAVRELWRSARISSKKVVLGVANQRVVVRQVDLPWLSPSERRSSLAFQVADQIPMPVDQAVLDVHVLSEHVDDQGLRLMRVLLVAAARETVGVQLEVARKAGLTVTAVDLTSFAVLRGLAHAPAAGMAGRTEAIVDIGASVTNVVVHRDGVPSFIRILMLGGDDVTDAVAERVGVPFEQAEALKVQLGLAHDPDGQPHPASRSIADAVGRLVEEVRVSLDYYAAQPDSEPVERIALSGGGSLLGGLDAWLSAATRQPVERTAALDSFPVVGAGLTESQLAVLAPVAGVPVGLALGAA